MSFDQEQEFLDPSEEPGGQPLLPVGVYLPSRGEVVMVDRGTPFDDALAKAKIQTTNEGDER